MKSPATLVLAGLLSACLHAQTPNNQPSDADRMLHCIPIEPGKKIEIILTSENMDVSKIPDVRGAATFSRKPGRDGTDGVYQTFSIEGPILRNSSGNEIRFVGTVPAAIVGGDYKGNDFQLRAPHTSFLIHPSRSAENEIAETCFHINSEYVPPKPPPPPPPPPANFTGFKATPVN